MNRLEALKAALEAKGGLRCIGADLELCDEYAIDGAECPMLKRSCGTCRGCYDDYDSAEPSAECTGGYSLSCSLRDTIASLVAVARRLERLCEGADNYEAYDDGATYTVDAVDVYDARDALATLLEEVPDDRA